MTTEILKAVPEGPITIEPVRARNAFARGKAREKLIDGLEDVAFAFPVPDLDAAYDAGDKLAPSGESWEPLFEADFDDVLKEVAREIAPEVGRLFTEALNRRLPWSTTQKGWRVLR